MSANADMLITSQFNVQALKAAGSFRLPSLSRNPRARDSRNKTHAPHDRVNRKEGLIRLLDFVFSMACNVN
jgi:hypothetical protein